jgi:hypothetical protein
MKGPRIKSRKTRGVQTVFGIILLSASVHHHSSGPLIRIAAPHSKNQPAPQPHRTYQLRHSSFGPLSSLGISSFVIFFRALLGDIKPDFDKIEPGLRRLEYPAHYLASFFESVKLHGQASGIS